MKWLLSLSIAVYSSALSAVTVLQPLEQAEWQLNADRFLCLLQQNVASVGLITFRAEPGVPLSLSLQLTKPYAELQYASVAVQSPQWRTAVASKIYYDAESYHTDTASFVEPALLLLQQIAQGQWLHFVMKSNTGEQQLLLSSVRAADAVAGLQQCISTMAPLSWQQARDTSLFFQSGQRNAGQEHLPALQKLARYIELDSRVSKVLIDAYTDDLGSSLSNRVLSQHMADDVAARLLEFGIRRELMELRAHGDRYPVASAEQAAVNNRRVEIRLVQKR